MKFSAKGLEEKEKKEKGVSTTDRSIMIERGWWLRHGCWL